MRISIRAYVSLLCLVAFAAAASLYAFGPAATRSDLAAVCALAGLGLVAQILSHSIGQSTAGAISSIPFVAAVLVAPNWSSALAVTLAVALAEPLKKRGALKAVFNVAQLSSAASLSALCFVALGGKGLFVESRPSFFSYAVLYCTFVALNTFAVSAAIGISERVSVLEVWKRNNLSNIPNDILASPLPYFFGWVYVSLGSEWAAGLAVPLLGVREIFKTNRQLQQTNDELLQLMVKAIEARDPYTSGHSRRVAHYSRIIARSLGLNSRVVDRIGRAALLHDVGKIHEIYAPILQKPGKLTPDEWVIMQTHPVKSEELVQTVTQLKDLLGAIRHHHENWDGSGYPDGIAGEAIPLGARIIMFADTVDAMTTDRPYRAAMDFAHVRHELVRMRGKQYDPKICDVLLESPHFASLFHSTASSRTPGFAPIVSGQQRKWRASSAKA